MWIRLKTETELLKESVEKLNYEVQLNEAINELQNDIFCHGLYNEDTGKAMKWLKEKLQKVCPSPDKLKEFFNGLGKKMDAKVQACKYEALKNAWNSLKGMMAADDIPDEPEGGEEANLENPEEGEIPDEEIPTDDGELEDGELEGGEEEEEELAAESLYEEGFWDSIKSGWNKLTGKSDKPARGRARKGAASRGKAKRGTATKKAGATKKGVAKRGVAKKGATRKGKKGAKKTSDWKSKIWEFIKGHWKQITIVLLALLALYFLGSWVAAMFMKSPVANTAAKEVSKFRLPPGMKKLPKGAKLVGNGIVKFKNGGWLACLDSDVDTDF